MSKINQTPEQFSDIVIAYLFDKALHPDEIAKGNELFTKFMEKQTSRGITPLLRDYYLSMPSNQRVKYKLIKDAFAGDTLANAVINIRPKNFEKIDKEKKKGIFKKILKKLVMSKEFSDEDMDYLKEVFEIDE